MGANTSPDPDGFHPGFFQQMWPIVGEDITNFCLLCLQSGSLPVGLNETTIVLIPKCHNHERVMDLRPISLCNFVYKCISKVLSNRMKSVLPSIISEHQSAFLPGRLISDNIMIAHEVCHYLKRKSRGKTGMAALKLDMSKAYDRVEWSFLSFMLRQLGFAEAWCNLILSCVTSVEYRILVNGALTESFKPSRGLRQGDPLSPYLFLLCAEGLLGLLLQAERRGWLHGCQVARGAPAVSHLFFVNDSLLFFKASKEECIRLKECLRMYEIASGQKMNLEKSSISFSRNVSQAHRADLSTLLGVSVMDNLGMYLGLPSIVGRGKRALFRFILDKTWRRLQGWNRKLLSQAGKEVLLKAVAQSIPVYLFSLFLLPSSLCGKLESMFSRFWWSKSGSQDRGLHWQSCEKLCHPKKKGGLGFRRMHESIYIAMLGKQA